MTNPGCPYCREPVVSLGAREVREFGSVNSATIERVGCLRCGYYKDLVPEEQAKTEQTYRLQSLFGR